MPRYDYTCPHCGNTETHFVSWETRQEAHPCSVEGCAGMAQYQFPVSAIKNFQPNEPFYCETLGVDVSGKRELKQIMRAMGLQEAGDPVNGARNFDAQAPHKLDKLPPQGRSLSDVQREKEAAAREPFVVEVENKDGSITPMDAKHLPSASDVKPHPEE